ncbi:ankyrin repeat-containing domain protein [Whalleya microplaca]|nr:ankyrin repeat-containing domain protein [Whalleya microplaca]
MHTGIYTRHTHKAMHACIYLQQEIVTLILSHLPSKASIQATTPAAPESESTAPAASPQAEVPYINLQNTFGNTALHWACLGGHLDVVKLLLSRGASPATPNDKDQIPLDLAAFNGHMHVVEYFLAQSRDLEGENAREGGLEKAAADVDMEEGGAGAEGDGGTGAVAEDASGG